VSGEHVLTIPSDSSSSSIGDLNYL